MLLIVGVFHLVAPRAAWYLHIGWKLRDAEPSDGYLMFLRVTGGAACLFSLIFIIVAFASPHA
ncbi:DUF6199 family natural product biosynthesis protein [Alicyclobacillus hesperidum]|uniref:DUF6199 family natural product biosynthesis protein n=1 Tax=Alicyclobacillus hesperidum TaxID=89784 RepID=UPI003D6663F8